MTSGRQRRLDRPIARWEKCLARLALGLGRPVRERGRRGGARSLLWAFRLAERLMEWHHPLHALRPGSVLRYEIAPLPAADLPLPGQLPARRGSRVVIIHFDNQAIATMARDTGTHALTWRMAREATRDLQALVAVSRSAAWPSEVRVVWAEGLFARALTRYGFNARPARRNMRTPFARLFLLSLVAIYAREGRQRLGDSRTLHLPLEEAWIGLDELQCRLAAR